MVRKTSLLATNRKSQSKSLLLFYFLVTASELNYGVKALPLFAHLLSRKTTLLLALVVKTKCLML